MPHNRIPAATHQWGGNGALVCFLFPCAKLAWCTLYPLQTREESGLLPLPMFSFILLLHQLAASDGQVSLVPGVGSLLALPCRVPAACKSFFITHLSKVIYKLQKQASINAALLVHIVKRLYIRPGHSRLTYFCALQCPVWYKFWAGCGETCLLSPPEALT